MTRFRFVIVSAGVGAAAEILFRVTVLWGGAARIEKPETEMLIYEMCMRHGDAIRMQPFI